jgi:hypothetical protein
LLQASDERDEHASDELEDLEDPADKRLSTSLSPSSISKLLLLYASDGFMTSGTRRSNLKFKALGLVMLAAVTSSSKSASSSLDLPFTAQMISPGLISSEARRSFGPRLAYLFSFKFHSATGVANFFIP